MHTPIVGVVRSHRNVICIHCGHRGFSSQYPDVHHAPDKLHPDVCHHCRLAGRTMDDVSNNADTSCPHSPTGEKISPNRSVNTTGDKLSPKGSPVVFAGHELDAPGFTSDQFERAILRAFVDELQIERRYDGRWFVFHPGDQHGYAVDRNRCDCPATAPCKHRALVVLHLDIREPARQRQWAKLHAERPVRKAVASC